MWARSGRLVVLELVAGVFFLIPFMVRPAEADLFVISEGTNQVLEFNGTTGGFDKVFANAPGGFTLPLTGLVFGPSGDLFVSTAFDAVLDFNGTTGAFVGPFVLDDTSRGFFPGGLVFGPNGDLFVTDRSQSVGGVLEFNGTTGRFDKTFVDSKSGGLLTPTGLVFGPSPSISVPEPSALSLMCLGFLSLAYARRVQERFPSG